MVVSNKEINEYRNLIKAMRESGGVTITVGVDEFKNLIDAVQRVVTIEGELKQAIAALNMKAPVVKEMENEDRKLNKPVSNEGIPEVDLSKDLNGKPPKKGWSI